MKLASDTLRDASRRQQLVEVSVFLFLIVPTMTPSFFAFEQGSLDFAIAGMSAPSFRQRVV